jgi:hypothetical protein
MEISLELSIPAPSVLLISLTDIPAGGATGFTLNEVPTKARHLDALTTTNATACAKTLTSTIPPGQHPIHVRRD